MRPVKKHKGQITQFYAIQCGGVFCDNATTVRNTDIKAAELEFASRGWGLSGNGWLCKECLAKVTADAGELIPGLSGMELRQLRNLKSQIGYEIAAAKMNSDAGLLSGLNVKLGLVVDEIDRRVMAKSQDF